jgi:peptide/nickel transport system substrate-binding protein
VETRGLTRRGLLKTAGVGVVGAVAASLPSWPPMAHGQGTRPATPKKGGTLRIAYAEEPKNLHTQIDSGTEGVYVGKQIYDSLLNIDPTGKIVPGLATGMPEQPSSLVYVFRLRKNVKFHNGKPFTADDVVWTFDRLLGKFPELQSTQASRFTGIIASVEKLDPYSVRITLRRPSPDFLVLMGGDKYMGIMQKDSELANPKEYGQSVVVGTGPFKLKEWNKANHLTLVRNDEYWGPPALVDRIVYRAIPEDSTRMVAMRAGDIDVLLAPALKDVRQYQNDKNFKVLAADGGNMKLFIFNTARVPFNDVRVRQAMAYAVNREEIVEAIYHGYASVAQDLLPPWNPSHDPSRKYYPYDPERAKKLLAEAGYGPGKPLEFEIITSDATEFVDLSTLIQAQLQQIGVRAKVISLDKSALTAKMFPQRGTVNPNFQATVYRLIFGFATADYGWRSYHPKSALDLTGYNQSGGAQNPAVPPLLDESAETLDPQDQRRIYGKLADLINADMPMLRIAFQKNVIIARGAVMDLGVTVMSTMPLRGVWLNQ